MTRLVWMWVGLLHKHGKIQDTPAIAAGIRSQNLRFKAIACLLMLSAAWVLPAPALSADAQALAAGGQSSNKAAVSGLGGPGSVPGTLGTDRQAKGIDAARVDYVEAYFDFKRQIKENYALAFGFDYNAIYQAASKSLGDDTAAGGVLRMFGQWTLAGRGTQNTGTLIYKVENRHRIGTDPGRRTHML